MAQATWNYVIFGITAVVIALLYFFPRPEQNTKSYYTTMAIWTTIIGLLIWKY
jgi:hypothetical protein